MKKVIILLIAMFVSFSASALEIKDLGFKSKEIKDFEIYTRDNYDNKYFMQANDIFAIGENDTYKLYIRAITNPGIIDYKADTDLIDEVFGLLDKVNTTQYSYISNKEIKWIRFDYIDKNNIPILEYFLSWKDVFITISAIGKNEEIPFETKKTIDEFVSTITLTGKGKVPVSNVYKQGTDYFKEVKKEENSYVLLIILCLCAIGITWFVTRKKN